MLCCDYFVHVTCFCFIVCFFGKREEFIFLFVTFSVSHIFLGSYDSMISLETCFYGEPNTLAARGPSPRTSCRVRAHSVPQWWGPVSRRSSPRRGPSQSYRASYSGYCISNMSYAHASWWRRWCRLAAGSTGGFPRATTTMKIDDSGIWHRINCCWCMYVK